MVNEPNLFDHMAACKLAEKRAIAVYGAVYSDALARRMDPWDAHLAAERSAREVPRPPPFRVPTALERQQAAEEWAARR